ncbi:MAG TPA: alkaline phosphatase family protein [Candidatus Cybelea sp.]|nr:alkaline phosphatase family protein [Candidatus Cybelea sp.]
MRSFSTPLRLPAGLLVAALCGCAQPATDRSSASGVAPATLAGSPAAYPARLRAAKRALLGGGKIEHVVFIVQENRSTDDLFNGLKNADTVTSGTNSAGTKIALLPISIAAPYDLTHTHDAFNTEFDGGLMDGFSFERSTCDATGTAKCKPDRQFRAYGIVPKTEVEPYFTMAESYAFADRMFATQAGPSFAAHQYIFSGTSTISPSSTLRAAELPLDTRQHFTGGCDSPVGSLVMLIDTNGTEDQQVYPCFDRPAMPDLLQPQGLTWRYYQTHPGAGAWDAPDAIKHIREGSQYSTDVVSPPAQVLTDIAKGNLANVVWITPTAAESDHAGITDGSGPDWVASIVNAVGKSKYWTNTAIFVTWDDWGGWYDHVPPVQYNSFELGFRVPLIAIGAYAKKGYVSHAQHEFGSLLKFTERVFGLGSLGATDVRSDDLSDCFNFARKPRAFKPIQTKRGPAYFLRQPVSWTDPDNE